MSTQDRTTEPAEYEVRVAGHLSPRWSAWFEGMAVIADDDGTTVLRGTVADQAALHGLLQKVRDLGLPLLSLTGVAHHDPTVPSPKEPLP